MIRQITWQSTIGQLTITASEVGISKLIHEVGTSQSDHPSDLVHRGKKQVDEYLSGYRKEFDLPLDLDGTDFQLSVWAAVRQITYGRTTTYLDMAKAINNTGAIRAVGAANGANPVPIIIPCHRVIGSDGSLTGYRYGVRLKRKLLALENPEKWSHIQGELW